MTADSRHQERADLSAVFGRAAADILEHSAAMPLHPLMAHPAAAMAAATAIGFGFSTQMAGAFWGAFQGAVEATHKLAAAIEEQSASAGPFGGAAATASKVERPAPEKAKPVISVVSKSAVAAAKTDIEPKPSAKILSVKAKAPVKPAAKEAPVAKAAPAAKETQARKPAAKKVSVAAVAEPVAVKPAPAKATRGGKVDDLKLISGIGPKLEQVLNDRGIRRFADIAAWSAEEAGRVDAELGFEGRIGRDGWVAQAQTLAAGTKAKK
ncbi:5' DNA nuclease [Rhizobium sp. BK251]|uniref:5' DNA nuclease n=1 Tax=Rhizobium sp. BK251 TaxID=2512125 RepID=UPI001049FDF8|nr:5' DNA nuclease [Rhizobium sp. BK251]TCL70417.1 NADH-quinone oxidoreductase subunit E [Rhizobium sp. BK251]